MAVLGGRAVCSQTLRGQTMETDNLGFYKEERAAMFIDGANMYSSSRDLEYDIDYERLLNFFKAQCRLVRSFYYTALPDESEFSSIRRLVDWLDYNGYTVVTKSMKEFTDSSGRRRVKGNMDMELAIDALDMSSYVDHVIVFSGDGDFRRLVEAIQRRGVRVTVVSTMSVMADELRRQADNFLNLHDLGDWLSRENLDHRGE